VQTLNTVLDAVIKVGAVLTAFGVITAALIGLIKKIRRTREKTEHMSQIIADNELMKNAQLSLLRAELIRSGEKYLEQGWIPIYAKDAYDKAYIAYHGLGGNGTMTELHTRVMALPTFEPENKED